MSVISGNPSTTAPTSGAMPGSLLPAITSTVPGSDRASPLSIGDINKKLQRRARAHKPPKDSKIFKVAMATIALKAQGRTYEEIAETLGHTKNTITTYLRRAHLKGWLNIDSFIDESDKVEFVLASKIVRNVNTILDQRDDETNEPTPAAIMMTVESAKGFGIFKNHAVNKIDGQQNVGVALKVQVEFAPGSTTPVPKVGSIGGQPAYDAEIIEVADVEP